MKKEYCARANKPCRSQEAAEAKVDSSTEYRRAYQCEFCDWWHITSRLRREDEVLAVHEPEEWDVD